MEASAQKAELELERSQTREDALEHASLAAELYMKASRLASSDSEKSRLRSKCMQLLSKAETIKSAPQWLPKPIPLKVPTSERSISKREEIILLEGSRLHGFKFPPWTSDPEDSEFDELVNGSEFYTEPTELELSDAQREIFAGWTRPGSRLSPDDPNHGSEDLMAPVDSVDLVQDITTDCSVVASLCAGTARASKGHGKVLRSICFPYNKSKLRPRVSNNGKYIFRLHFNGCFRRVTIDDRLPASNTSRRLHVVDRNNPQLLWPALIEKAYLKVRGGYDFPGSNSGTDLWVISGWMPEQVFLRSDEIQPEQLWNRIYKAFGYGDVMITLGTGKLSRKEERASGLAGEHDYAVLDMKEIGSQRLLLVKNPWCDGMVWKKSIYIPDDLEESTEAWTQELRSTLPDTAITPGTFWMSIEDVVQHYESLYLNWNPGLFRYRQDHHFSWTIPQINNPGSFTHNPQYSLKSAKKDTVWILLSRHFATGEQAVIKNKLSTASTTSSVLGFISIYIFEASGRRVILSDDALHRGAYVDSPQTLARLDILPHESYTVVVAQHGLPLPKYSFTLSFFSREHLIVDTASDNLSHCTTHTGAWTSRTAGGNASAPSYPINPQYSISIPSTTNLALVLETDQEELAVHVKMVWAGGERVSAVTARDIVGGSGDYRRGCALASLSNVAPGKYTVVCSTFEAGQIGNFTLRVSSMVPCKVTPILAETAGRLSLQLPVLIFHHGIERMLAPLTLSRLTRLRIVARTRSSTHGKNPSSKSRALLKVSLEKGQGPNKSILEVSGGGDFSDAPMGIRTRDLDLNTEMMSQGGLWIVVERLGGGNTPGEVKVEVEVLSDCPVGVEVWGVGDG